VVTTESCEEKKFLLESYIRLSPHRYPLLPDVLKETYLPENILDDNERQRLYAAHLGQIQDDGPLELWENSVARLNWQDLGILSGDSSMRDRAYVLWDLDRLREFNLSKLGHWLEGDPIPRLRYYKPGEYDDMVKSFRERRRIFLKGGTGYWRKGDDVSGVVYDTSPGWMALLNG